MQVDVVSPEQALFSGEANAVYARSLDGEIGILPGHQPALLALDVAPVRVQTEGGEEVFAVHSGFLQFADNHLSVLAEVAEPADRIDAGRAREAQRRAEQAVGADEDDEAARDALKRANLRLRLSGG